MKTIDTLLMGATLIAAGACIAWSLAAADPLTISGPARVIDRAAAPHVQLEPRLGLDWRGWRGLLCGLAASRLAFRAARHTACVSPRRPWLAGLLTALRADGRNIRMTPNLPALRAYKGGNPDFLS